MVRRLFDAHVEPEMAYLKAIYEDVRQQATAVIGGDLKQLRQGRGSKKPDSKLSWLRRLFGNQQKSVMSFHQRLADLEQQTGDAEPGLAKSCKKALLTVANSIIGHRGNLVGDDDTIISLAVGLVLNDWASLKIGEAVAPLFEKGATTEGYRLLPGQDKPFIMNVKGASAAGKSTIRPKQRALAERLGIAWEDFALVSPDYWRKYLLDYESLGEYHKYGAVLTGHELAIIDRKLDRQMARRAEAGKIPHLLIDRFRFDSFSVGNDQSSQLLTRFGDTVFMFYMITPPEATVERAYQRGLITGRYKAVDDLLDHNIEAYTGMPALFFSWASTAKRVHHEFLDNSVDLGAVPKTVAFGWNDALTILDIGKLLDIERYKRIDVEALAPEAVYLEMVAAAQENLDFLVQCARSMPVLRFADQRTGQLYGIMEAGEWVMQDTAALHATKPSRDTLAGLEALGWEGTDFGSTSNGSTTLDPQADDCTTLGSWGNGSQD